MGQQLNTRARARVARYTRGERRDRQRERGREHERREFTPAARKADKPLFRITPTEQHRATVARPHPVRPNAGARRVTRGGPLNLTHCEQARATGAARLAVAGRHPRWGAREGTPRRRGNTQAGSRSSRRRRSGGGAHHVNHHECARAPEPREVCVRVRCECVATVRAVRAGCDVHVRARGGGGAPAARAGGMVLACRGDRQVMVSCRHGGNQAHGRQQPCWVNDASSFARAKAREPREATPCHSRPHLRPVQVYTPALDQPSAGAPPPPPPPPVHVHSAPRAQPQPHITQ